MRRHHRHTWTIAALALIGLVSSSVASAWAATCQGPCKLQPAMPCCEPGVAEAPATTQIRATGCCDRRRPAPHASAARSEELAPVRTVSHRDAAAPVAVAVAVHPASRPSRAPGPSPVRAALSPPPRTAVLLL